MFKCVFYMTSISTIYYLLCFHIHIVICGTENNQNGLSKNESRKMFIEHGEANRQSRNWSNQGRQRHKANIEFLSPRSKELLLQENSRPHFRIQPEPEDKPEMNISISFPKIINQNNNGHTREGNGSQDWAAHSREAYLRSEANQTLKRHFHPNPPPNDNKGLSIDDKGASAGKNVIAVDTGAPRRIQSIKEGNKHRSPIRTPVKHSRTTHIHTRYNEDYKNWNKHISKESPSKTLQKFLSGRERFERDPYRYTSQIEKGHNKSKMMDIPTERITKTSSIDNVLNAGRFKKIVQVKRNEVNKATKNFINDVRQRNKGTVKNNRPRSNTLRYGQHAYSSELTESGVEERYRSREGPNREVRAHGKKGHGVVREEHNEDRVEHDQGQKPRNHGRDGHFRNHKGRGHGKKERDTEEHGISQEDQDQSNYKSRYKEGSGKVRVTEGNDLIHEKSTTKYDRNEPNKFVSSSYESIQINSAEDRSDSALSQENKKNIARTPPPFGKKKHPSLKDYKSPLRTQFSEKEPFAPYSIGKRLNHLKECYREVAKIEQEVLGRTVEYNEIVLWKIRENPSASARYNFRTNSKKKYADDPPEKKIVFIVHGLSVMGWHGIDCLSKVNRFKTLLEYYLENLDCFDIYLIPMANPDGVAKAAVEPLWNKNVSPQNACPGVNLDRNFDVGYNGSYNVGQTMSSCSQMYPGPRAFSEHETKAVRDVFFKYGHKIVAYFHVHAGTYDGSVFKGDAVLYPRGFSEQNTDDDKYIDLRADIEEAMRNTSFKVISVNVDTLYNWYGKVKGTSVDYASTVYGIPYAMELVMQIYTDGDYVDDEDKGERNSALTEIWQIVLDVLFDSIYRRAVKPNEI